MSQLTQSFIETAQHFPTAVENPLGIVAAGALMGLGLGVERSAFNHTKEKFAAEFPNPDLAKAVIKTDPKTERRERMAGVYAVTAGLGFLAAQYLGHPTYETTTHDNNANVVVVEDVSFSMQLTNDLEGTVANRASAVQSGIEQATFKGNLGLIQSGATAKVTSPLSKTWQTRLAKAEVTHVDPNGSDLVTAINLGVSLLPSTKTEKHDGSLVVITDGTIDQRTPELTANAKELERQGVDIKIIVPGTAEGTYKLKGSSIKVASGADAKKFAAYGQDNIIEATDTKSVEAAIAANLADASERPEKRTSDTLGWLGALVLSAGIVRIVGKTVTRIV